MPSPDTAPGKTNVLGVNISTTSYAAVVNQWRQWLAGEDAGQQAATRYICVTSVHGIITARHDLGLRRIINGADIATPDGMPVVWALRSFGASEQQRVYGPTLMLHLCREAARLGKGIFLYGGHGDTLARLTERLESSIPDLNIAGTHAPPFRALTAEEDAFVVDRIRCSGASLVFVGISTPKQEQWMWQHRSAFPGVTMVGVGAAFDFHAGNVRQAPPWMQSAGLEWLFRLLMQPKRLWKRYLLVTPRFLPLWALQKAGWLKPEVVS